MKTTRIYCDDCRVIIHTEAGYRISNEMRITGLPHYPNLLVVNKIYTLQDVTYHVLHTSPE